MKGIVTWVDVQRGFGFIEPGDGGSDVFVHVSQVQASGIRDLEEGDVVSFETATDTRKNKPNAVNLRLV